MAVKTETLRMPGLLVEGEPKAAEFSRVRRLPGVPGADVMFAGGRRVVAAADEVATLYARLLREPVGVSKPLAGDQA